jgi:hypothetical protein
MARKDDDSAAVAKLNALADKMAADLDALRAQPMPWETTEVDRSLASDPGRWPTRHVADTGETVPKERGGGWGFRGRDRSDTGRSGKGRVGRGESGERIEWSDQQWRDARDDYQRQNPPHEERPFQARPGDDRWR